MRRDVLIVPMTLLLAAAPWGASAQVRGPQDSVVRAALARITPGKQIRVSAAGQGRLAGPFASATDSAVTLGTAPPATSVRLSAIDSLWQRGSAAGTGALVGAVTLGLAGAALGASAAEALETDRGETAVVVGLIGVAGGALVGGVIGALTPTWKRRVP